ncbi:MAG: thiamine pyrophosphate-requiring protein [Bauldia sp.]
MLSTAERLLERMKALGVDYVFGNAGTDFPPIIEAFARAAGTGADLPSPIVVAHETAAVGMAHGFYLATGRAQCVMVHVNVGLANAAMGILNAAADNVAILICSGRTPITEHGRHGSRSRPIHWGQEMRDQGAMVREAVKWDYELRYPEQGGFVVERALAIAGSDPPGPVYLSLPREVLAETTSPPPVTTRQRPVKAGAPRAEAVGAAVEIIRRAASPVIIAQRPPAPGNWEALATLADRFAIPVVDFWATRSVIGTDHPMYVGGDPAAWLADADAVITVEAMVPWLANAGSVGSSPKVIAVGVDPLFQRVPARSFPVDVALAGDPALTLAALADGLRVHEQEGRDAILRRRQAVAQRRHIARSLAAERAAKGAGAPMSRAWLSRCLSEAKAETAAVFNELGCDPSVMRFERPDTYFSAPLSGGLGWALPAALGYQLADRDREVIACVGDGSYIFANPLACHLVAMANHLPVLTVVVNNGLWQAVRRATLAMYPDGNAARANVMPFTELTPGLDYAAIARAHGCFGERVADGAALPEVIDRALKIVRKERSPALIDAIIAPD